MPNGQEPRRVQLAEPETVPERIEATLNYINNNGEKIFARRLRALERPTWPAGIRPRAAERSAAREHQIRTFTFF